MAETEDRRLAAIMITDIVGYSALTQRSEAAALRVLDTYQQIVRRGVSARGGIEIKTMGDGFLVEFASAISAVEAAVEIQRELNEHNEQAAEEDEVNVRIGLHVGEVIHRESDVFGDGVNIASRIEPLADAGGICMSLDTARQVERRLDLPVHMVGMSELKGIDLPVGICKIGLPWKPPQKGPRLGTQRDPVRMARDARRVALVAVSVLAVAIVLGAVLPGRGCGRDPSETDVAATSKGPVPGGQKRAGDGPAGTGEAQPEAPRKSIAVLPFINMSPDEENEYFSDGVTEEIINALAQIEELRVVSRTSSFAFKGRDEDIRAIAEQLGVNTILEGSVRKSGDDLRVTAQLIDAGSGYHLWSDTYDRSVEDVFSIQEEISQTIASTLEAELGSRGPKGGPRRAGNMMAYTLYLRGRHQANRWSKESLERAIEYYEEALAEDPNYAPAWAGLADCYDILALHGMMRPRDAFPKAKEAALKALALDADLAEGHAALCLVQACYDGDWDAAVESINKALELKPNYAVAHERLAYSLAIRGDAKEAVRRIRRAVELSPMDIGLRLSAAHVCYASDDLREALKNIQAVLRLDPGNPAAHLLLALSQVQMGQLTQAFASIERASQSADTEMHALPIRIWAMAAAGQTDKARAAVETYEGAYRESYVPPSSIAACHAALGDIDAAFEWLDVAYEERDPGLLFLRVYSMFDSLRDDPRFDVLLGKMNLPTKTDWPGPSARPGGDR